MERIDDRGVPLRNAGSYLYYRHTLPVRIMHWINVIALTVLFMSGLQIFNAYPVLHFGKSSYDGTPHALEIGARSTPTTVIGRHPRVRRGVRHHRLSWPRVRPRRRTGGRPRFRRG